MLNAVHFPTSESGWVVGFGGIIWITRDGGATWTAQASGTTMPLYSVYFVDALTGWAVGAGIILKTSDGGATWIVQYTGPAGFNSVHFVDANTGWVAGGQDIWKTTDGGDSWTAQDPRLTPMFPNFSWGLSDIHFIDANIGHAVGTETAPSCGRTCIPVIASVNLHLSTMDGGATWIPQQKIGAGSTTVHFFDSANGWAGGNGFIQSTKDGGATWTTRGISPTGYTYYSFFHDPGTGWAVSRNGTIQKTTDSGATWSTQNQGWTDEYYRLVFFLDSNTGWVVGRYGGGSPTYIRKTSNGGDTWTRLTASGISSIHLYSVHFVSADIGYVVGYDGGIFKTVDGGNNWTVQKFNPAYPWSLTDTLYDLKSVAFVGRDTGWAAGTAMVRTGAIDQYGSDVWSWFGAALRTTDGGARWTTQYVDSAADIRSIGFIGANLGWAVGVGRIFKTTDGGENWVRQTNGVSGSLNSVHFLDTDHGWAVGNNGVILGTADGGTSWNLQAGGMTTDWFNSVRFADAATGWVVGNYSTYKTTDGGNTWTLQMSGQGGGTSIHIGDAKHAWIVGGGLLKTTIDGITTPIVNAPAPKPFSFFQSGDAIFYNLARNAQVLATLYDLNGKAVFRMSVGMKKKGGHILELQPFQIKPGLYLLRLQANNDVRSGKVLLGR